MNTSPKFAARLAVGIVFSCSLAASVAPPAALAQTAEKSAKSAAKADAKKDPKKDAKSAKAIADDKRYDQIVDDFIRYDVGELRGEEGLRAHGQFQAINDEAAIPALIRGVNKTAKINNSCPIIVVSAKLAQLLNSKRDPRQLRAAIDGLEANQHDVYGSYVQNLRESLDGLLSTVAKTEPQFTREVKLGTAGGLRRARTPADKWTLEDITEGVSIEKDAELVRLLEQLQNRKGSEYTAALVEAIGKVSDENKLIARGLLAQRLARMTDETLLAALKDLNDEIRGAAARAVGYKGSPICEELADCVRDGNAMISENAHGALIKLLGEDLGPAEKASAAERFECSKRWAKLIASRESEKQ